MENEVPHANWMERLLYFLGRRQAFLVDGDSMLPTLRSGAVVLVDRHSRIKTGDLALAKHPYKSSVKILKRVGEIGPDGRFMLLGDNPSESTDSRAFGAVSIELIIGRVVCRLK